MKQLLIFSSFFFLSFHLKAQDIRSYKADDLINRMNNPDTIYVVNFWATWCGPCIKELPELMALEKQYASQTVKVLLVSLDFKEAYPKKIASFVKKKKLEMEVVWLNESNANEFIPKIEPRWEGSIPATLIIYPKKDYKNFFEGMITSKQISTVIDRQLAF